MKMFKKILLVSGLLSLVTGTASSAVYYTIKSGDWSDVKIWCSASGGTCGTTLPSSADIVIIEKGYNVTVRDQRSCSEVFVINSGSSKPSLLKISAGELAVSGDVWISSTSSGTQEAALELHTGALLSVGGHLKVLASKQPASVEIFDNSVFSVSGNIELRSLGLNQADFIVRDNSGITVKGDIIFKADAAGTAKVQLKDQAVLSLRGNFDRTAAGNFGELDCEQSTAVNFEGNARQVVSIKSFGASTATWRYGEIRLNNTAEAKLDAPVSQTSAANTVREDIWIQSGIFSNGGHSISLAPAMTFTVDSGATYRNVSKAPDGGLPQSGQVKIHPGSFTEFGADSGQVLTALPGGAAYGNLIIPHHSEVTMADNISIAGDIIINGALSASPSGYNLYVAGDWTCDGIFAPWSGNVAFNGSEDQDVTGSGLLQFQSLEIIKPAGEAAAFVPIMIESSLTLSNGILSVKDHNIELADGAVISGGTSTAYVNTAGSGKLVWNVSGTGNVFLPVGNDGYRPLEITLNAGTSCIGTCTIGAGTRGEAAPLNSFPQYLTRHWTITSSGFSGINYDITASYGSHEVAGSPNSLATVLFTPSIITLGPPDHSAAKLREKGLTDIPVDFVLTAGGGNILPVLLTKFNAEVHGDAVILHWATATELNNRHFIPERSANGTEFTALGMIDGAGTSTTEIQYSFTDEHPLGGMSYYRLRQVDRNGVETWSGLQAVNVSLNHEVSVYPNPARESSPFQVECSGFANEEVFLMLTDQFGRDVYAKMHVATDGLIHLASPSGMHLVPGIYFIAGSSNNRMFRQKLIVTL